MATVMDIIQGISQAAANAYDGSQYENYSYDRTGAGCWTDFIMVINIHKIRYYFYSIWHFYKNI